MTPKAPARWPFRQSMMKISQILYFSVKCFRRANAVIIYHYIFNMHIAHTHLTRNVRFVNLWMNARERKKEKRKGPLINI